MGSITKQELDAAFVDVRKAYRLLYHYQKRVLDLMQFISDSLPFSFEAGHSRFSSPTPKDKRVDLGRWAWDWLNLYLYEFHFGTTKIDGKKISFSIVLQSDTGFFDKEATAKTKIDVSKFVKPEISKTCLIFVAGYNHWNEEILACPNKYLSKDNTYVFNEVNEAIGKEKAMLLCAKSYDLSLFVDEESTLAQIDDFNLFCSAIGLAIKDMTVEVASSRSNNNDGL
ncbi:hypothetical protein [uncultured Sunxiuqinia sp.]|uniref:hypothetical protein n=1 Tax=uncultured Sunxiuqinia sp. TaxID=1573825 RepID=UPI0026196626|nr:hypothetical protein [uncultured Sunxiuqinia sp.]